MYGPVCTVVWQGSAGDRRPYADQTGLSESRIYRPERRIMNDDRQQVRDGDYTPVGLRGFHDQCQPQPPLWTVDSKTIYGSRETATSAK